MPLYALLLAWLQLPGIPVTLPPLDVGGAIEGPYIFREDMGQTTKVILQNGLTVIVREQNAVPLVGITTLVRAGYFNEPDRLSGISHVVEHMFFKGTAEREPGAIARETRGLGGTLNAYTAYDRTVYHVVVPSDGAVGAMEVQADALWNPAFDAEELAREIEVVLEENNRKLDNPAAVAEERLYATAFEAHRIGRWRIGTPSGLRALTREDLLAYYQHYYQPSNIVLAVVGRFSREEMLAEIVRLYGAAPDSPVERATGPEEGAQTSPRYGWERGAIGATHAGLGFHVPGVLGDDAYALELISAILTGGRASRLNRILRDELGVLQSAVSSYLGFPDFGFLRIQFETRTPLAAERAVIEELERMRRFGVTEEELARARGQLAVAHYRGLETVEGAGQQLAIHEALGGWKRLDAFLPGIQGVTREDVQRVVATWFTPANLSLFEYAPDAAELASTLGRLRAEVLDSIPADMVERTNEALPVSAAVPASAGGALVNDLIAEPRTISVLRGPDVHVFGDSRLPLVSFGIFFPGGRLYETPGNAGITELMLSSALMGTRRYSAAAIARRLENAGARLEPVNEPDFFGYVLEGLEGSLGEALTILMDVLNDPTFPESQVDRQRALQEARLARMRDDAYTHAVGEFTRVLFEGHAYARPAVGLEASVASLTADDVRAWHRARQRGVMPEIVIVGATSGSGLVNAITDALTNEDLSDLDIREMAPAEPFSVSGEFVLETDRRQSALVYGAVGPGLAEEDPAALTVLEHLMSGLGGRLFDTIRDEAGLAYTVRTVDDFRALSGSFLTYTAFSPANEGEVRRLLDAGVEGLIRGELPEDELTRARNSALGRRSVGMQTRRARTLEYARWILSGSGIEAARGFSDRIAGVDAEAIGAAARQYLDPESATIVVLRGRE